MRMRKSFLIVFALLLVVCMGIFAFSACRKTATVSGEEANSPDVQTQEEQPTNDPLEPLAPQDDVSTDPGQGDFDEETSETPDPSEESLQPEPAPSDSTEDESEKDAAIVKDPAQEIDPNVDWEHGWQP